MATCKKTLQADDRAKNTTQAAWLPAPHFRLQVRLCRNQAVDGMTAGSDWCIACSIDHDQRFAVYKGDVTECPKAERCAPVGFMKVYDSSYAGFKDITARVEDADLFANDQTFRAASAVIDIEDQ